MREKDEKPARGSGQPAQPPAAASGQPPDPGEPPSPASGPKAFPPAELSETNAILAEMTGRLGKVEEQLTEFHRRSAHRESIVDRLHDENQRLRSGFGRLVLDPVITDLIRLHDQLSQESRRLESGGQDPHMLRSFASEVLEILARCGIDAFSAEPGEQFARDRHRPLAAVPCDDESRHNTVVEVVTMGFAERETGRIRRPLQARFYHCPRGRDGAGPGQDQDAGSPGHDAAQAQ